MKHKLELIFELIVEIIFLYFLIIGVFGNLSFLNTCFLFPFIIILLTAAFKCIFLLKYGVVNESYFNKITFIGFFIFIIYILISLTYSAISMEKYVFLIILLFIWIFSLVYFKKRIFDDYDIIVSLFKKPHFLSVLLLSTLIIFSIFGFVLIYFGVNSISNNSFKDYVKTTGYFVSYDVVDSDDSAIYKLIYEYEVDGEVYQVMTDYSTNSLPNIGSTRIVKYNPFNPSQSVIVGGTNVYLMLFLGVLFFLMPLAMLSDFLPESINKFFVVKNFIAGGTFFAIGLFGFYFFTGSFSISDFFKNFVINYFPIYVLFFCFIIIGICIMIKSFIKK